MRRLLLLVFLFLVIKNYAQENIEKYHRARIHYQSTDELQQLSNLGLAVDHGIKKPNVFIESDFSVSEITLARENGFQIDIIIEDVSNYYIEQNKSENSSRSIQNSDCINPGDTYQTPVNFNIWPASNFGGYYTYSQVLQELDDMAALYPNLITIAADISNFTTEGTPDTGTTPSIGSNTIKWVKISDNPNSSAEGEPQILYTSIHHAREPASLSQLLFYMWYLLENYSSDPEIQSIVDNTELYFIPVINPDGYLYNELIAPNGGGLWRKNRNNTSGVDNNRNYDYYINGDSNNNTWGGPGSSSNPSSNLYHGSGPFSEIENQAIKWFVEQHDFVLALNNHTFGELIYYPFGYDDVPTPDESVFQGITQVLVSENGYTPIRSFPFSGDSDDFMYGTVGTHQKIFAMTPEISTSFWPAQAAIESICKDMMFTNLAAAQLVGNYGVLSNTADPFIDMTSSEAIYSVQRLGLQDPGNFTISINPISDNIVTVGPDNTHNGLNFLESQTGSISLDLDPLISPGEEVSYELIINNGLFEKSILVNRYFGQPSTLLSEEGDDVTPNWNLTSWAATTEDFVSANSSITDSPNSNYSNNSSSDIVLINPIDLTGAVAASLSYQARWEIEDGFDYVQVEISNNNGLSWTPQCGLYTNNGTGNQSGATNEPVYDGFQTTWIQEHIDLSDYLDQSILLRFNLVSDGSVTEDGFYFDDLEIRIIQDNLSLDDYAFKNVRLFPNPVDKNLHIQSTLDNYSVSLYSIHGQQIIPERNFSGTGILNVSDLSSGFYLLQLKSKNNQQIFKIIVD